MKITKYEHACLVIEEQGKKLVIDPGSFSVSLPVSLDNIVGVVITHAHFDHFDAARLKNILDKNNNAVIFCTDEVAKELNQPNVKAITGGNSGEVGPFDLKFFGGQHAIVDPDRPIAQNIGVFVNNKLYFPGDSLDAPSTPIKLLALPISGPWIKTAEDLEFLKKLKPRSAFPTHDALLTELGQKFTNDWLKQASDRLGIQYTVLAVGESIDI